MIPLKQKAAVHQEVRRAIQLGLLVRPTRCQECDGTQKRPLEGHHWDYSKPLDVEWLCKSCHQRRHRVRVGRPTMNLRLSRELWVRLKHHALAQGTDVQSLIVSALGRAYSDMPDEIKHHRLSSSAPVPLVPEVIQ